MKTIWKYRIPVQDSIYEVLMPKNSELLHVGMTELMDKIWLWALVETDSPKEIRRFRIYGTGHELVVNAKTGYGTYDTFVGTAYSCGKPLVWHLFEVK